MSYDQKARYSQQFRTTTPASMLSESSRGSRSSSARSSTGTGITTPGMIHYSKKLVVVGDGGCGKTCLLISYSQGYFPEKYIPTVFENYITQKIHRSSGKNVELALWDTAGQEEYDRLRPLSYPETDVIFVCFAVDSPHSLENVMDKWYPEVLHFCPNTPLVLVGLKTDLRSNRTCLELLSAQGMSPVTTQQGQQTATRMGALYRECSSKRGEGVEDLFNLGIDLAVGGPEGIAERKQLGISKGPGISKKKKSKSCRIL